jgi:hypothetical protein
VVTRVSHTSTHVHIAIYYYTRTDDLIEHITTLSREIMLYGLIKS